MTPTSSHCDLSRRHALRLLINGGLVLLATGWAVSESEAASWQVVGKVTDFPRGTPRRVVLSGGLVAYVLHTTQDRWLALRASCTHEGGEVRWDTQQKCFVCPLHGARFTATGEKKDGPGRGALAHLPVQRQGTTVQVDRQGARATKKRHHHDDDDDDDEKG